MVRFATVRLAILRLMRAVLPMKSSSCQHAIPDVFKNNTGHLILGMLHNSQQFNTFCLLMRLSGGSKPSAVLAALAVQGLSLQSACIFQGVVGFTKITRQPSFWICNCMWILGLTLKRHHPRTAVSYARAPTPS